jgi:hypothetical protein
MKVTLHKSKGVKWNQLQHFEQVEILEQFPKLNVDPQIREYMFYRSTKFGWIVTNAFEVGMRTTKKIFTS